jgi:outer membrane protein OmpA-like peptidoglycan-associated protein
MKMSHLRHTLLVSIMAFFASITANGQLTDEQKADTTITNEVENQKLQLLVTDYDSKRLIDADVMVKGLNPRKTMVFKGISDTIMDLKKYRLYTVSVVKEGYMYFAHKFWPDEAAVHLERIELKPLMQGVRTSIEDIYFLGDETEIYYKSLPALEELITFLAINPTLKVQVIGHANGPITEMKRNSDAYYRKASEKRAVAVVDYLVQHGIERSRLTTKGVGNKQMMYPDPQTEWQVSSNRRIEIEVTGFTE